MKNNILNSILLAIFIFCTASELNAWQPVETIIIPNDTYPTIQSAVDAAQNYTEILLKPGVYSEEVDLKGKILKIASASEPAVMRNPAGYSFLFHKAEGPNTILKNLILAGGLYGIYISEASPTLENLTIVNNKFGIKAHFNDNPDIVNCILWNNKFGDLDECVPRYSCYSGGLPEDNNISEDPLFVDASNGDFHLQSQEGHYDSSGQWINDSQTSPCINTGDPASRIWDEPMPNGCRINMGAYGGTAYASKKVDKYGGGSGTEIDPYQIWTAVQMNSIGLRREDWDKHFALMTDIDLSAYTGTQYNLIGYSTTSGNNPDRIEYTFIGFTGVFDGRNHTIDNFTWISTEGDCVGLFGVVDGIIKNINLTNVNIQVDYGKWCGGLVAHFDDGLVTNCLVTGTVKGYYYIGGLLGYNDGDCNNCSTEVDVYGNNIAGGICGFNDGTISNCYVTGSIIGAGADPWRLGGLCGENDDGGTIINCYATSSITGGSYSDYLGGLCGFNDGTISNCYTTGAIAGENSQFVGGFCGKNNIGYIGNCFWDIETSGQNMSDGGTGLPTKEMQKQVTFLNAGWDFIDVWAMGDNQSYPYLRNYLAADINHDGIVNLLDIVIMSRQWLEVKE